MVAGRTASVLALLLFEVGIASQAQILQGVLDAQPGNSVITIGNTAAGWTLFSGIPICSHTAHTHVWRSERLHTLQLYDQRKRAYSGRSGYLFGGLEQLSDRCIVLHGYVALFL